MREAKEIFICICYLLAGRSVSRKTVSELFRYDPRHSFLDTDGPRPANNFLFKRQTFNSFAFPKWTEP